MGVKWIDGNGEEDGEGTGIGRTGIGRTGIGRTGWRGEWEGGDDGENKEKWNGDWYL
jgi:hypothetical protein